MNTICHIEFESTDLGRSQAFYEALFGWTFRQFTDEMVVFGQGDKHIGGLQKVASPRTGGSPSIWFDVEDLDAMVEKAMSIGGTLIQPKSEVPHVGWSAQVGDADGNTVGMVQFSER